MASQEIKMFETFITTLMGIIPVTFAIFVSILLAMPLVFLIAFVITKLSEFIK